MATLRKSGSQGSAGSSAEHAADAPGTPGLVQVFDEELDASAAAKAARRTRTEALLALVHVPQLELLRTLRTYNEGGKGQERITGDLSAGLVVAVMLIPQGLAYASLASLPPQYGLYASIVSLFLYPLFGSSPQVAVGPTALMALLTAGAITQMGIEDGEAAEGRRIEVALRLAFLVGVIQAAMGLFNAGALVQFLSQPMLSGFTAAAAIIIGSSQLGQLLRLPVASSRQVYNVWIDAGRQLGDAHGLTVGLAAANFAMFWGLKWARKYALSLEKRRAGSGQPGDVAVAARNSAILKAIPTSLLVVIVNIVIVVAGDLQGEGVAVVGSFAAGLPAPVNIFGGSASADFGALLPTAFLMALIGFMESISVAKAMAMRFGGRLAPNQELVGLGLANALGAPFNTFPITGAFSRTVVNADAGAATTVAGLVSGAFLLLTVYLLLPLFANLPQVTLGALIVFAVSKLLDAAVPARLWALDHGDFAVYVVTFLATLLLGIEEGIMVGAGVSLAKVLWHASRPHTAVLGRLLHPATGAPTRMWRSVRHYPGCTRQVPRVKVFRFDSSLFFANAEHFKDCLLALARPPGAGDLGADVRGREPLGLVVDLAGCATLDSSALHVVEGLPEELRKGALKWRGERLAAANAALAALGGVGGNTGPAPAPDTPLATADTPSASSGAWLRSEAARLTVEMDALRAKTAVPPRLFLVALQRRVRRVLARAQVLAQAGADATAAYEGGCWYCEVQVPRREADHDAEAPAHELHGHGTTHEDLDVALEVIKGRLGVHEGLTPCQCTTGGMPAPPSPLQGDSKAVPTVVGSKAPALEAAAEAVVAPVTPPPAPPAAGEAAPPPTPPTP